MLELTCYSIVSSVYRDDMTKYIGYMEVYQGLGINLGPVLGAVFNSLYGFEITMYICAGLNGVCLILCVLLYPSSLNKTIEEAAAEAPSQSPESPKALPQKDYTSISVKMLLSNRRNIFCILTCFVGTFNVFIWNGWLTSDLTNKGFNPDYVGYIMTGESVLYLIACLVVPYIKLPRQVLFIISLVGLGIAQLLLGPSEIFGSNSVWLQIAAFPLLGAFQVFFFVPIIPEMIESMQVGL